MFHFRCSCFIYTFTEKSVILQSNARHVPRHALLGAERTGGLCIESPRTTFEPSDFSLKFSLVPALSYLVTFRNIVVRWGIFLPGYWVWKLTNVSAVSPVLEYCRKLPWSCHDDDQGAKGRPQGEGCNTQRN